jgi:NADH-quinone oxidoreductase subunit L
VSATTFGWLILLFPLLGTVLIGLGFRVLKGTTPGWLATLAIGLSFASSVGALISLLGQPESHRELTSTLWNYAASVGVDA